VARQLEALAEQGELGDAQRLSQELAAEIENFVACFERAMLSS